MGFVTFSMAGVARGAAEAPLRLLAAAAVIMTVLSARPLWAGPPGVGVVGGVGINDGSWSGSNLFRTNFATSGGPMGIEITSEAGVIVGGFGSIPVTRSVSFMPEVLYAQRHFGQRGTQDLEGYSAAIKIDNVEVPLLFSVDWTGDRAVRSYIIAGPALAFIARAKRTDERFGDTLFPDEDLKRVNRRGADPFSTIGGDPSSTIPGGQVETVDVALIGGAGVGVGRWSAEVRYEYGLRNLNKEDVGEDFEMRRRSVSLLGRWHF